MKSLLWTWVILLFVVSTLNAVACLPEKRPLGQPGKIPRPSEYFQNLKNTYLSDAISNRKIGIEIEFALPKGQEHVRIDEGSSEQRHHLERVVRHIYEDILDKDATVIIYNFREEVPDDFRDRVTTIPFYLIKLKNGLTYHIHFDEYNLEISAPPFLYGSADYILFMKIVQGVFSLGYQGVNSGKGVSVQINVDMQHDDAGPLFSLLKHWEKFNGYWMQVFSPTEMRQKHFLNPLSNFFPQNMLERTLGQGNWYQFYTELQYLMNTTSRRDHFDLSLKPLFYIWLDLLVCKDAHTKGRNAIEMRILDTPDLDDSNWQVKIQNMIEASLALVEGAHDDFLQIDY